MNKLKAVVWAVIFTAVCVVSAALCVYAAKTIGDAVSGFYGDVPVTRASRAAADGNAPYTALYDGKEVRIKDSDGREVYKFALTAGSVPDEELAELSRGVTVGDAEDVWALIESYTS